MNAGASRGDVVKRDMMAALELAQECGKATRAKPL